MITTSDVAMKRLLVTAPMSPRSRSPAIVCKPSDMYFIPTGMRERIIFMTEDDAFRSNVGCQNGGMNTIHVNLELFNTAGESLEVKALDLAPLSNAQINRIFRAYAPMEGYVEVWTDTADSSFICFGSVVDNPTGDPTTVMPQ